MTLCTKLFVAAGLVVVLLSHGAAGAAALSQGGSGGSDPSHAESRGNIGIRLLEASSNCRDDPRALVYIVDHINPGTTISRRFEITNTSGRPRRVAVYPGAAEVRHSRFVPAPNRNANELSSWVSVDRSELVVPAHGRVPLKATISIPTSASKGERYGAIWAEAASTTPGPGGNVQMINRVGIRIYLDVGPGGDPPSDFCIERLTPGRTADGLPVVRATVRNTGERALDLSGWMWLSEGPGGLNAGPFRAQVGTTLVPRGDTSVEVALDHRLPDGPWKVKLALESGRIHRTVTGRLTFPAKPASWGPPAVLDSSLGWPLLVAGVLVAAAVALLVLIAARRLRRRRRHATV